MYIQRFYYFIPLTSSLAFLLIFFFFNEREKRQKKGDILFCYSRFPFVRAKSERRVCVLFSIFFFIFCLFFLVFIFFLLHFGVVGRRKIEKISPLPNYGFQCTISIFLLYSDILVRVFQEYVLFFFFFKCLDPVLLSLH